jgi:hypothetical protein
VSSEGLSAKDHVLTYSSEREESRAELGKIWRLDP